MIKVIQKEEVEKVLKNSFLNFELPEDELHLSDQMYIARSRLDEINGFEALLANTVSDTQLDWVLDQCVGNKKYKLFSNEVALSFTNQSNILRQKKVLTPLAVEVFVDILGIDIPDNSKDELEFEMFMHISTKKEGLLGFLRDNNFIDDKEKEVLRAKWDGEDYYVETEREKSLIDKVLDFDLEGYFSKMVKEQQYQLQFDDSSEICYSKRMIYTFKNLMETDDYPFDHNTVQLMFASTSNYDPSEIEFKPMEIRETIRDSVFISNTFTLRGFYVNCTQRDVLCASYYQDAGSYMQNAAMLELILIRDTSAFLWRSFIPATIITSIGLISSALATFKTGYSDSVMHQVIPALLISIVGIQYTTSQYLPFRAGKTKIDLLFVRIYLSFVVLYISLVFADYTISRYLSFASMLFAVISISNVALKNRKHVKKATRLTMKII